MIEGVRSNRVTAANLIEIGVVFDNYTLSLIVHSAKLKWRFTNDISKNLLFVLDGRYHFVFDLRR